MVYAIEVWGSACTTELQKIIVLQKTAVRIISHKDSAPGPLYPTDSLFHLLEILKIHDIFKLQVSKFIFNCINSNVPTNFQNWFKFNYNVHSYNTRSAFFDIDNDVDIDNAINSNTLFRRNARTTHCGLKLLKVSGPKMWNLIPNHIRSIQPLILFRLRLKKHLIAQYVL